MIEPVICVVWKTAMMPGPIFEYRHARCFNPQDMKLPVIETRTLDAADLAADATCAGCGKLLFEYQEELEMRPCPFCGGAHSTRALAPGFQRVPHIIVYAIGLSSLANRYLCGRYPTSVKERLFLALMLKGEPISHAEVSHAEVPSGVNHDMRDPPPFIASWSRIRWSLARKSRRSRSLLKRRQEALTMMRR